MPTDPPKRRAWPTIFAIVLVSLPLLYALSIGPVYGICVPRNWAYITTLDPIYRPLIRVARLYRQPNRPAPAEVCIETYIAWCIDNFKP